MELRTRQLVVNNQPIAVKEVTGLAAVPAPADRPASDSVTLQMNGKQITIPFVRFDHVARMIPDAEWADLAAFQRAGWYFIETEKLPGKPDKVLAHVLIDPQGHVKLAPNRVTVKFTDADADPASVFPVGVVKSTPVGF